MMTDCVASELARVQANLLVLVDILGEAPERVEGFVFRVAARDLELSEGLSPDLAASELEDRVTGANNRVHALLNQCGFQAIRALDQRLALQVAQRPGVIP